LFCALIGLYNFGKQCGEESDFINEAFDITNEHTSDDDQIETPSNKQIDKKRDDLADKMWKDHQLYIQAI
jgi:hypothetical protein